MYEQVAISLYLFYLALNVNIRPGRSIREPKIIIYKYLI